jgi:hypothetical protein
MRAFVGALVGCVLLTACSSSPSSSGGARPWLDDTGAATSGGRIGGAGPDCPMPVTFDVAKSWKAKTVTNTAADEERGLVARQGGFTLVCEVDAKPAGNIGFLRVWTATATHPDGGPMENLGKFLGADHYITIPEYRSVTLGTVTATECTYVRDHPEADVKKRERVLAVPTAHGTVILALGGLDTEEHEQMLPAYVLAKNTLRVTG